MLKPYKVNLDVEHQERIRDMAHRLHMTRSALIRAMVGYYFDTLDTLTEKEQAKWLKKQAKAIEKAMGEAQKEGGK